jgi:hypothetical protein
MLAVFYFAYTVLSFFAVFDRLHCFACIASLALLHLHVDARRMALIVNLPENMKGRTPSWSKQRVLIWAQVVFEGKRPS